MNQDTKNFPCCQSQPQSGSNAIPSMVFFCPAVSQYTDIIGTHQENTISGKTENFHKNKQIQIFKFGGLEQKHFGFYHQFELHLPCNSVSHLLLT